MSNPSLNVIKTFVSSLALSVVVAGGVVSGGALTVAHAQAQQSGNAAQAAQAFKDSSRLISVGGSLTEIIYALNEGDRLVARDQTSVYPPQVSSLPDVGYMRALSAEGVLSVAPTALLIEEGSGPVETLDVLQKASIELIMVPQSYSHQGIIDKINIVGKALNVEAKADALAAKVDADLKAVEADNAKMSERKRVLFILSRQGGRIMAAGSDTSADGIIKLAGGINAVDQFSGYKQLTDEALDAIAPDLILLMNNGGDANLNKDADHSELLSNPALATTPAGRNRAVLAMDGMYLLGFGPRTAAAARDLSAALYGGKS